MIKRVLVIAVVAAITMTSVAYGASKITGLQIKDGTVTGKDIKDHSLTAKDFKGGLPAGMPGPAGAKGDAGPAGGQGPAGSPGRDGAGATVVGSLPVGSLSIAANETKEKTLGTVGPFTVVLSCENDTRAYPEGTYWDTSASLYVRTPGMPNGYIAGAATGNWEDSTYGTGVNFGSVDMPSVGKIGIVANFDVTQTSCSASDIKTYLN